MSGIQRVNRDGTVELLFSEVAGYQLYGPNDLAFGPDGRLYFTESGSEQDFRFDVRAPGRLFAAHPDPRWVARPGTSLHRLGTELDLGPAGGAVATGDARAGLALDVFAYRARKVERRSQLRRNVLRPDA